MAVPFLQVRDFILWGTTLTVNIETSQIERALSLGLSRGLIGCLYGILKSTATVNTLATKQIWEKDLGVEIVDEDWCKIFENAKTFSLCNRVWSIHLRIIH